jgi:benzoyl-CoA reductase/2-hydroxyglutaryl-CoA dehydratase subunit BcrC/BadD/HgdB
MYSWFIDLPSVVDTPEAAEFAVEELKAFVSSLESAFGVSITDDDLAASIHDGNEKRALLRRIYMLKSEPRPIVSGAEVFSLILESMTGGMGTEELCGVMDDLESREEPREDRTRVMVLGTDLDDPRIFAAIEDQGAVVVADNLCTSGLHIWQDVEPEGDPLAAIAQRCLLGINCPLKHPLDLSLARVEEMVDRFRVEKAVFIWPQACDPMGWTVPFIRKMLEARGIEHCWVAVSGAGGEHDLSRVKEAVRRLT